MSKINKIINEELESLLNELIDPNSGNTYYPQGLDPKVVKLFEKLKEELDKKIKENEESVGKN